MPFANPYIVENIHSVYVGFHVVEYCACVEALVNKSIAVIHSHEKHMDILVICELCYVASHKPVLYTSEDINHLLDAKKVYEHRLPVLIKKPDSK